MNAIGVILGSGYLLLFACAVFITFFDESTRLALTMKGEIEALVLLGVASMVCFALGRICEHFVPATKEEQDGRWEWTQEVDDR